MAYDPDKFADDMMSGFLGGYSAGRERRRLAQETGKDPGALNTFVEGLRMARTAPRTPEQHIAALNAVNQQKLVDARLKQMASELLIQNKELEDRNNDSLILAESFTKLQGSYNDGDFNAIRGAVPPPGLSSFGRREFMNAKESFINKDLEQRTMQFKDLGDRLSAMGVSQDALPETLGGRMSMLEERLDIRQRESITSNIRDVVSDPELMRALEDRGIYQLSVNPNTGQVSIGRYGQGQTPGSSSSPVSVSAVNSMNKLQDELDQLVHWSKQEKVPIQAQEAGYITKADLSAKISSLRGQMQNLQVSQGLVSQEQITMQNSRSAFLEQIKAALGNPGINSSILRNSVPNSAVSPQ